MVNKAWDDLFDGLEAYPIGDDHRREYRENGFFIAPDLVPAELLEALRDRLDSAARGELDSGIFRQVEPKIAKSGGADGDPIDYTRKVAKLAENDEFFRRFVCNRRLLSVIHGLFGENIRYFGDEAQLKPAQVGSAHPWHQDAPYFHREPMEVATVWIAVDDATVENGCLEVIPGAHRRGMLPRPDPSRPWFETGELDLSEAVHAEVPAGGALIFDVLVPHGSGPNNSPYRRRSMISRYVNLASVKPNQIDAVRKHGVLTDEPGAHSIFSPLPEAMDGAKT